MTDDIVTRLRAEADRCHASPCDCQCPNLNAAADEIERLRNELATSHLECEMADQAVQELQRLAKGLHQRWQEALNRD